MIPISIDQSEMFLGITNYYKNYEKNLTNPLMYMDYFEKLNKVMLSEKKERPKIEYLAPSVPEMFRQKKLIQRIANENRPNEKTKMLLELGCKKLVHPDKYIINLYGKDYEIWTNSSLNGVRLRIGYVDGDSRILSNLGLDDDNAHFKVGARTGAGKSVLMNDIIMSMMLEYAPFEVMLYLFDLKIVEMSRYGTNVKAPHVSCIGATEDIDYIVSALYFFEEEMRKMQELFGLFGFQKLSQLRKACKMIIPHKTALADEFTQLYELANQSQVKEINKLLSSVIRLGRATGYHLGICSQNFTGTLDKQLLGNFKASIALPCTQETSTALIGNDMAGFLKGKGRCYSNELSGKKEENVLHTVPFIENEGNDSPFLECLRGLRKVADEYDCATTLNFYTENEVSVGIENNVNPYDLFSNDIVILGDTTRYKTDKDPTEFLRLTREAGQNILVVSQDVDDLVYALKLILTSLKKKDNPTFIEMRGDILANKYFNISEYIDLDLLDKSQVTNDESYWDMIFGIIKLRKEVVIKGDDSENEDAVEMAKSMKEKYNVDYVDASMFKPVYIIVNGAHEIKGLGKTQNTRFMNEFSELVDEAPKYGVHFILTVDKVTDRLNAAADLFVHRIFGNLYSKDQTRLNYDSTNLKKTCLAYQDFKNQRGSYKFKKYKEKFNKPEMSVLKRK